jgi:hypothetical protein
MKRLLFSLFLSSALAAQAVQLADGRLLAGDVQNVSGDGLVLVRVDTGGTLQLRWDHLSAESANELKRAFNLSLDDESEVTTEADVITYVAPTGRTEEMVGRHVGGTGDVVEIRSRGTTMPIQKRTINSWVKRKVPATSVLTKDELYRGQLAEVAPGEDADKHIQLADVMVRVGDYDHAQEHLKRAEQLGNSKQPQALKAKLARVELYKAAAGERALLEQVKVSRFRKEFQRGRELIAEFEKKYPQSKLMPEMTAEKQRFEAARERFYIDKVVQAWTQNISLVAKAKLVDAGTGLQTIKDYAESGMGKDIRKKVAERLQLQVAEVEALWGKRIESGVVTSSTQYSYGIGSWILGDKKIIAGTQQEKAGETGKEKSQQQQQDERLQRKIQEFLKRQEQAAKNAGTAPKEDTDEDWWKQASSDERLNFLRSYYAEFSGDLELVSAHVVPCTTCGAEGVLKALGSAGGQEQNIKCWTCKRTKFRRWIRVR